MKLENQMMNEEVKPVLEIDLEEFKAYIQNYIEEKSYEHWLLYGTGLGDNLLGLTLEKDDKYF